MPRHASRRSECVMWPSHCEAADPRVVDEPTDVLPEQVLAECKALGWRLDRLRRCWYCDTIWAEDYATDAKHVVGFTVSGNSPVWATTAELARRKKP